MPYLMLADALLVVHAAFVVFVVLGGVLVWLRPRAAWLHLPAVVWGVGTVLVAPANRAVGSPPEALGAEPVSFPNRSGGRVAAWHVPGRRGRGVCPSQRDSLLEPASNTKAGRSAASTRSR